MFEAKDLKAVKLSDLRRRNSSVSDHLLDLLSADQNRLLVAIGPYLTGEERHGKVRETKAQIAKAIIEADKAGRIKEYADTGLGADVGEVHTLLVKSLKQIGFVFESNRLTDIQ